MIWFIFTLCAAALYAVSNHVDKYIHNRYPEGPTNAVTPLVLCVLFGCTLPVIYLVNPAVVQVPATTLFLMLLAGEVYVFSLLFYHAALTMDEASRVSPLFRLTPFFAYVFGLIGLGEHLSIREMLGSLFILLGAILMTVSKDFRIKKWRVLLLMSLSSACMAGNAFMFKFAAVVTDFWSATFWQTVGIVIGGLLLLVARSSYREHVLTILRKDKVVFLGATSIDTAIVIIARLLSGGAILLAPISLVSIVNSFQSFFVILLGIIITRFFPRFGREDITWRALVHKIYPTILLVLGSGLILLS